MYYFIIYLYYYLFHLSSYFFRQLAFLKVWWSTPTSLHTEIIMPTGFVAYRGKESVFEWKIEYFSFDVHVYRSYNFLFDDKDWYLRLFPKNDGYVQLELYLDTRYAYAQVELSVSLKTIEGTKSFERRDRQICGKQRYSYCFYSIPQWFSKSEFSNRQREFLSLGCLTILLTMKSIEYGESKSHSRLLEMSKCVLKQFIWKKKIIMRYLKWLYIFLSSIILRTPITVIWLNLILVMLTSFTKYF